MILQVMVTQLYSKVIRVKPTSYILIYSYINGIQKSILKDLKFFTAAT
jgi:hypothetical protein